MTGPVIHRDIEQHSDRWYAIKAGKWSASKAGTIMGGLETKGVADLVQDMAWGRVYGATDSGFQSTSMLRGLDTEAEARDWYVFERGAAIEEVGFVEHATIPNVGWSPDGLCMGQSKAIEIKCPLHKAWMETLRTGKIPSQYRWQCKWAMWVGQLDEMDFIAYHPSPGGLIVPCTITGDEKDQMTARVGILEARVHEWVELLNNRRQAA